MKLPGMVASAPSGILGFDTDTVITTKTANALYAFGYHFCIRYLSLGAEQNEGDLSSAEALCILNAGLALSAVQHVRFPGWNPNASMGSRDGTNAVENALSVGFPYGVNLWCDLEGVTSLASATQVIDYCSAWYVAVEATGFVPGLYVGASAILEGEALYGLPFEHYWKSLSTVPAIPIRGYQMVQSNEHEVAGIVIDDNRTQTDQQGGSVIWLAPN